MRRIVALVCALVLLGLNANAEDKAKEKETPKRTPEQKALWKEIVKKYDANSDKKLDKEERAKISADDKEKLEKAGLTPKKQKKKQ
jgi:hypothetical protein